MKVRISIPIGIYQALVGRCLLASREYAILKNAVISHVPTNSREGNIVEIFCGLEDAKLLLTLASVTYPSAVPYIDEAIRAPDRSVGVSLVGMEESKHRPTEYRIKTSGDTWHFCSNCSQWPTIDFIASKELPGPEQLCNECLVKSEHDKCG